MKVLMLGQSTAAGGGIAEVINELLCGAAQIGSDCQITYIPTSHKKGIRGQYFYFVALARVFKLCLSKQVDGVHMHLAARGSTFRKLLLGYLFRLFKTPYIIQMHSGDYDQFYSKMPFTIKRKTEKLFSRAASVVTLSNQANSWIKSTFTDVTPLTIPNGVSDCGEGDPLPSRKFHIVYVGRVVESKGLSELVNAIPTIKSQIKDIQVTILGDGEIDYYKKLAMSLGVTDAIVFKGWRDRSEVISALKQHKVFVLPSWYEGLPMSMLEAMAAGPAVVVTSVGAIPDVITNYKNGIICPPRDFKALADALILCLKNEEQAEQLSINARKDFENKYSSKIMARKYLDLYEQCFSK